MRKFLIATILVLSLPAVSEAGCKGGLLARVKENVQERRLNRTGCSPVQKVASAGLFPLRAVKSLPASSCANGKCGLGVIK